MKKFRLVKNKRGEMCAIAYGRQWILHITEGTSLNKHFAVFWDDIVSFFNRSISTGGIENLIEEWRERNEH